MSLHHNYIVLLCGIADAFLNGVPSDHPLPLTFSFISKRFASHFMVLFLNEREVWNKLHQQDNTCDVCV